MIEEKLNKEIKKKLKKGLLILLSKLAIPIAIIVIIFILVVLDFIIIILLVVLFLSIVNMSSYEYCFITLLVCSFKIIVAIDFDFASHKVSKIGFTASNIYFETPPAIQKMMIISNKFNNFF